MEPLARELERLIATFTEGVTSAVRSTALALVDDVLSNTGTRSARAKKAVARRPRSVRLLRRGAADIDAVKGRLLAAIGSRPGLRFEQLRAGLSLDRREVVLL